MTTAIDATLERIGESGGRALRRRLRDAWSAARRPRPEKWCGDHIRLDRQVEASTTRFDLSGRPWWRDILAAITDPDIRSVTVMASTQVGKTLNLIASILYCAEHDPAPALVVLPDEQTAIEFRDRVYGNAVASIQAGTVSRIRVPRAWRWNRRHIDLGTMRVYLAWSQSRQRLRGRPCRRVFLSEVDVFEGAKKSGDPVTQAHQRTKAFFRVLHYHESSPTEHPSPIESLERAADLRLRWQCPCPRCGWWQELRFFQVDGRGGIKGILDEGGEPLSVDAARLGAYYECVHCAEPIKQELKQRFVSSGKWYPVGHDANAAEPPPRNESARSLGFHLWTVHSETQTWGDVGASWVQAKEDGKLRDWWGNALGLPYRVKSRVAPWYEVGQRLAGVHPRGTVPAESWFVTAGLDVQGDSNGCRYVVRAWGPERTSWLVDWGWIDRQGDETDAGRIIRGDLRLAGERILAGVWPVHGRESGLRSGLGASELTARLLCVDSGHAPKKIHEWLRSLPADWVVGNGSERVRAVRGDSAIGSARFQRSVVERNVRTGEVYDGGMVVWRVSVTELYPDFVERLFAPPHKPGSWHVTSDAMTLGKSYLQQVTNLERRVLLDANTGAKKIQWGPRQHGIPIDFCDCEIYAEFAAEMVVGDMGWSSAAWEQWRDGRKRGAERTTTPIRRDVDLSDR